MRRAARTDENQIQLVSQLRGQGYSVVSLSAVGKGVPDLLVGYNGKNYLFEVKDPDKSPSQRKLTPDQIKFHASWEGQISVIEEINDAIEIIEADDA